MIPLEVWGLQRDGRNHPCVWLRNDDRLLPVSVGICEADAISAAIVKRDYGRPMTHDLICNLLAGLRANLTSVVIYKLENEIYYAHLNIEQLNENGDVVQVLRVDSRPSDSIAIALRVGCPIFASQDVMDRGGQNFPVGMTDEESDSDNEPDDEPESDY